MNIQEKKDAASAWFLTLRNHICMEFEAIEREMGSTAAFTRTSWNRPEGGGGEMSLMKGKVFEKVGVNISSVHGEFSEIMRKEIPGADKDPRFWASGISLVAHMCSPLIPAVHMNTRMIVVGSDEMGNWGIGELEKRNIPASDSSIPQFPNSPIPRLPTPRLWFGGGADLTPMIVVDQDTQDFHAAFKKTCDAHDPAYYAKFKAWCDEYFHLKHRREARGVGGIFYDYVDTGDWQKDFAFTQAVGQTLAKIYPELVRRHMHEAWTLDQRELQLVKRGRYVEFNLLYDRGTKFGLMTGGNTEAILMSMPPEVKWP